MPPTSAAMPWSAPAWGGPVPIEWREEDWFNPDPWYGPPAQPSINCNGFPDQEGIGYGRYPGPSPYSTQPGIASYPEVVPLVHSFGNPMHGPMLAASLSEGL